jgi:hypothetical protein
MMEKVVVLGNHKNMVQGEAWNILERVTNCAPRTLDNIGQSPAVQDLQKGAKHPPKHRPSKDLKGNPHPLNIRSATCPKHP